MPVHIDNPAPGMPFEPERFTVRGWLWLEERHARLAAVEAWSGDQRLGEGREFSVRADVNTKYALAPETRTAFEFVASHPAVTASQRFDLELRPRFKDGSAGPAIFTSRVGPFPLEHDPRAKLKHHVAADSLGLEIGAHTQPVPGLNPFYTDAVSDFVNTAGHVDFLSDAGALPLPDDTLDYLCSSHVLEHLPNPIAALHEWHRVLRPGGWLYLVVPDKRFTFDHPRPITSPAHLLQDFHHGRTAATSLEHVEEFIYQTDWSLLHPHVAPNDRATAQASARRNYLRALRQGRAIDIHFHTFTPDSLRQVLDAAGFIGKGESRFELAAEAERYPPERRDGIGVLLRKTGTPRRSSVPVTFAVTRADAGSPTLPLVCPVTLSPLRQDTAADGAPMLVADAPRHSYPFETSFPVLVPPTGVMPQRPWIRATSTKPAPVFSLQDLAECNLDEPAAKVTVDPLNFFVRGWLWLEAAHGSIAAVEAWCGETLLGSTTGLYDRPDVSAALGLPPGSRTGFDLFAHHPRALFGAPFSIEIRVRLHDRTQTETLATRVVTAIGRDYRQNHFGVLLNQTTTGIQRREQVFSQGPSLHKANPEISLLIQRYLGPPPKRIIQVGWGVGSYGRSLLAEGYDWMGAEIDAADAAELVRQGLPHCHTDGTILPFADASFDAAICLDVLEHVDDPDSFVREIRRIAPRQLLVSVPNCELLAYLYDHHAVPWHLLERDHKHFFTRWSLGALLGHYYRNVELRFHARYPLQTVEGTILHYHLFAVATSAP